MTHEPDRPTVDIAGSEQVSSQPDPVTIVESPTETDSSNGTDLDAIRALVLRAHPDAVPEMIGGDTVDDLLASIEPAEAAFRRISESLQRVTPPSTPTTLVVPAGGDRPLPVDPERLPASEKIRRGLARR